MHIVYERHPIQEQLRVVASLIFEHRRDQREPSEQLAGCAWVEVRRPANRAQAVRFQGIAFAGKHNAVALLAVIHHQDRAIETATHASQVLVAVDVTVPVSYTHLTLPTIYSV